jgi:hypothetical protein
MAQNSSALRLAPPTTPGGGEVPLTWTAVPDAQEYHVYEVDPATGGETLLLATPDTSATLAVPANTVRVLVVKAAR